MSNTTKKNRMYVKLHGQRKYVDEIYTWESVVLREYYKGEHRGVIRLEINNSNILEKALDFCKNRAEIKIQYSKDFHDDKKLLQDKLKDFDADFLKQIKSDDDVDIIHLIDAACKLEIRSLVELFVDEVVEMMTHKSPQDIENIFRILYNGDDRKLELMKDLMSTAYWIRTKEDI